MVIGSRLLIRQHHDFNLAKLARMTFRLQRDASFLQQQIVSRDQRLRIFVFWIQLRLRVFQNNFAVEDMSDDFASSNFNFGRHPFVQMVRVRR